MTAAEARELAINAPVDPEVDSAIRTILISIKRKAEQGGISISLSEAVPNQDFTPTEMEAIFKRLCLFGYKVVYKRQEEWRDMCMPVVWTPIIEW